MFLKEPKMGEKKRAMDPKAFFLTYPFINKYKYYFSIPCTACHFRVFFIDKFSFLFIIIFSSILDFFSVNLR